MNASLVRDFQPLDQLESRLVDSWREVARAQWFLPQIDEAFRLGDLSYSKVRALTRVASDVTEAELLAFALDASAAQCEAFCRGLRNGDRVASAADARRLRESRSLVRQFREDGSGTLTVELPKESLELVLTALERIGTRLPGDPTRSLFAKGADALVAMAREVLAGETGGRSNCLPRKMAVPFGRRGQCIAAVRWNVFHDGVSGWGWDVRLLLIPGVGN